MKPILLFYGYITFKSGKPCKKYIFESLDELRRALLDRYKGCDLDRLYTLVQPFRAYGIYRKIGTQSKVVKLYDKVSKTSLISNEIHD